MMVGEDKKNRNVFVAVAILFFICKIIIIL